MSHMTPLVISYVRFSSAEQQHGDSQRRQLEASAAWAKKHSVKITENLSDLGVSAFRGKNTTEGALGAFLELVKGGKIPQGSTLLVEELDRLSRQEPEESLHLFLSIVRAGVKIVTLNTGEQFEKGKIDMGRLMMSVVKFCTAHDESQKKSDRIGKAWAQKRRDIASKIYTGRLPAWLRNDGGKIVVDEEKAKVVKQIFRWALAGWGLSKIVHELNRTGGGLARVDYFQRSYVLKILHNRAVIGEFQPHRYVQSPAGRRREADGNVVVGYFPSIVPENDFYAVQRALKLRRTKTGASTKFVNLFTGLLYCREDGSALVIQDKGYGKRYASSAAVLGLKGHAPFVSFPVAPFEQAMLMALGHHREFHQTTKRDGTADEIESTRARITEIDGKIKAVQASLTGGDVSRTGSVLTLLNQLDAQRAGCSARLDELSEQRGASAGESWEQLTPFLEMVLDGVKDHDQRLLLRGVFAAVVKRVDCDMTRDGRDYVCRCDVTLMDGREITFEFTARHVETMLRNAKGHPVKSEHQSIGWICS